jgi:hypothetical protein
LLKHFGEATPARSETGGLRTHGICKHFATTFKNIKKAVQAQMGEVLRVEETARVKVHVPRAVRLEYVDEAKLEVMTVGEKEMVGAYGRHGRYELETDGGDGMKSTSQPKALLFEFHASHPHPTSLPRQIFVFCQFQGHHQLQYAQGKHKHMICNKYCRSSAS